MRFIATTRAAGASTATASYWKTFKNACKPYDGPALPYLRRRLQGARRLVLGPAELAAQPAAPRLRPLEARPARRRAARLALDRELAQLEIHADWAFGRPSTCSGGSPTRAARSRLRHDPSASRATATGAASTSTPSTRRTAPGGSASRGSLLHRRTGRSATASGRPEKSAPRAIRANLRQPAPGERYRITVVGPGVTPGSSSGKATGSPHSIRQPGAGRARACDERVARPARRRATVLPERSTEHRTALIGGTSTMPAGRSRRATVARRRRDGRSRSSPPRARGRRRFERAARRRAPRRSAPTPVAPCRGRRERPRA